MTAWDADELVDVLDRCTAAVGETWDIWRTHDRRWCVKRRSALPGPDPLERTVNRDTLTEALRAALDSKRIPMIPRRPVPIDVGRTTVTKLSGSRPWRAEIAGLYAGGYRTKREAQEAIDGFVARSAKAVAEWDAEHAPFVAAHVEGVDFVFEGTPR